MNKTTKTFALISVASATLLTLILYSIIPFGKFLNIFMQCENCPECSYPCYAKYDIFMMVFLGIVTVVSLIILLINTFKNKRIIFIFILLIINSMLIFSYIFPFQDIVDLFTRQEAAAIGIIGGADGPTAIFISSQINWYIVILIVVEIILAIFLLLALLKKTQIKSSL